MSVSGEKETEYMVFNSVIDPCIFPECLKISNVPYIALNLSSRLLFLAIPRYKRVGELESQDLRMKRTTARIQGVYLCT